jgi:hypothetical protein
MQLAGAPDIFRRKTTVQAGPPSGGDPGDVGQGRDT